jgi:hypothetical protein
MNNPPEVPRKFTRREVRKVIAQREIETALGVAQDARFGAIPSDTALLCLYSILKEWSERES